MSTTPAAVEAAILSALHQFRDAQTAALAHCQQENDALKAALATATAQIAAFAVEQANIAAKERKWKAVVAKQKASLLRASKLGEVLATVIDDVTLALTRGTVNRAALHAEGVGPGAADDDGPDEEDDVTPTEPMVEASPSSGGGLGTDNTAAGNANRGPNPTGNTAPKRVIADDDDPDDCNDVTHTARTVEALLSNGGEQETDTSTAGHATSILAGTTAPTDDELSTSTTSASRPTPDTGRTPRKRTAPVFLAALAEFACPPPRMRFDSRAFGRFASAAAPPSKKPLLGPGPH